MRSVRPLLLMGNEKLGQSIFHFDLPAIVTCPGRSAVCEQVCYAGQGRFLFPQVQERLQWCYQQSRRGDFAQRMAGEVHGKGILVVRIHVSGDFYNAGYAAKWLAVMRQCPRARFYFYTRSWRSPEIAAVLEQMARLLGNRGKSSDRSRRAVATTVGQYRLGSGLTAGGRDGRVQVMTEISAYLRKANLRKYGCDHAQPKGCP